jgi:hypothetical protein
MGQETRSLECLWRHLALASAHRRGNSYPRLSSAPAILKRKLLVAHPRTAIRLDRIIAAQNFSKISRGIDETC